MDDKELIERLHSWADDAAASKRGGEATMRDAAARLTALAEENERLKAAIVYVYTRGYRAGHHDTVEGGFVDVRQSEETTYFAEDANTALSEVPR